jgi:hypothetical protein
MQEPLWTNTNYEHIIILKQNTNMLTRIVLHKTIFLRSHLPCSDEGAHLMITEGSRMDS